MIRVLALKSVAPGLRHVCSTYSMDTPGELTIVLKAFWWLPGGLAYISGTWVKR
jgi:hypothetical protein